MPRIRQAQSGDVPRMQEIAILAWSPVFVLHEHLMGRRLFKIFYPNWKAVKGSEIKIHFEKYPHWTFVIEEDNLVVGFLTYYLDSERKIGEIGNNAVHPDYQGRGLGESLHREALRRFEGSGMAYARVRTGLDDAHRPARGAYEKLGFKPISRSVDYYLKLPSERL